jgi:hypothetical protein
MFMAPSADWDEARPFHPASPTLFVLENDALIEAVTGG